MARNQGPNQYQINEVSTSNQGKLILMMYDGAIRFVTMAMESMDQNDVAHKSAYIQRSRDIVNELMVALDTDKGGEVTRNLERLYQFILRQLTHANIKNDKDALQSILRVMTPLREAWGQILRPETNSESSAGGASQSGFAARC
ncbi:Flagellar protein FliS [Nitrospina gracilis 3/211]|uniref:Flagellar secretion chaperone FliS n=1 Tax=Nitrospina gracilis (strain 3/211) TaxID=1266370 RepID=M1Z1R9_NITG3|nr:MULTISPECIES: flagellar export chaperone FliS [Nitrospina]MCF8724682.1 flagellar protein FliS [Nitrospina sp. Nb-3]CCQ91953.1 Flagellar protein FliS [Nitrospina gracilis 3/211]